MQAINPVHVSYLGSFIVPNYGEDSTPGTTWTVSLIVSRLFSKFFYYIWLFAFIDLSALFLLLLRGFSIPFVISSRNIRSKGEPMKRTDLFSTIEYCVWYHRFYLLFFCRYFLLPLLLSCSLLRFVAGMFSFLFMSPLSYTPSPFTESQCNFKKQQSG